MPSSESAFRQVLDNQEAILRIVGGRAQDQGGNVELFVELVPSSFPPPPGRTVHSHMVLSGSALSALTADEAIDALRDCGPLRHASNGDLQKVLAFLRKPPAATAPAARPVPQAPPALVLSAIAGIGDLQRAGPASLAAAKARMDVVFEANRVEAHGPAFVYDTRKAFAATAASEWDD